jgi:hypothetical protein
MLKKIPKRTKVLLLIAVVSAIAAAGLGIWGYGSGKITTTAEESQRCTITGTVATVEKCPYYQTTQKNMKVQAKPNWPLPYEKALQYKFDSMVKDTGEYLIKDIPCKSYTLSASGPCKGPDQCSCQSETKTVSFTSPGQSQTVPLAILPVNGYLKIEVKQKCVPSPGRRCLTSSTPVSGAEVTYETADNPPQTDTILSDANGRIDFGSTTVGTFKVSATNANGSKSCYKEKTIIGCENNELICMME